MLKIKGFGLRFLSESALSTCLSATLLSATLGAGLLGLIGFPDKSMAHQTESPSEDLEAERAAVQALIDEGRLEEAIARLETMRQSHPEDPEILLALGQTNQSLGYFTESEEALRKLVETDPDHAEGWFWLGYTCYYHGEHNRLDPMRKTAAYIVSRYRDAVAAFEHAVEITPSDPEAWVGLGLSYFFVPELEQAALTYRRGIDACPTEKTAQLQYLLGNLHVHYLPDYDRAIAALLASREIESGRAELELDLAEAYIRSKDEEKGLERLLECLRISTGFQPAYDRIWRLFGQEKRYGKAQEFLERAQAAGLEDPKLAWYQGYYHLEAKEHDAAIAAFRKAIEQNPAFDTAYVLMARAYTETERTSDAVEALKKALEINSENPQAKARWIALAREVGGAGDYEAALALFDEIVERFPGEAELVADRALTLANLSRTEEAIAEYRKAIALDPFDTRLVNDLALVYESLQDFKMAMDLYRQAETTAQDLDAMENLGVLQMKFGNHRQAQVQFAKVLRIDPNRERSLYLFHKCLRTLPRKQREEMKSRTTGNPK